MSWVAMALQSFGTIIGTTAAILVPVYLYGAEHLSTIDQRTAALESRVASLETQERDVEKRWDLLMVDLRGVRDSIDNLRTAIINKQDRKP